MTLFYDDLPLQQSYFHDIFIRRCKRTCKVRAPAEHQGTLGLNPGVEADKPHRIDAARVRADMARAGFKFVGSDGFLENATDDPTKLVFDPAVRGKTSRFFYRFVKP